MREESIQQALKKHRSDKPEMDQINNKCTPSLVPLIETGYVKAGPNSCGLHLPYSLPKI